MYDITRLGPDEVLIRDWSGSEIARLKGGNTIQILLTYARYIGEGKQGEADLFLFGVTMGLIYTSMGGVGIFRNPMPSPSEN